MKRWNITRYDGGENVFEAWVGGKTGRRQIEAILERLQARHLTENEVIAATLNKSDKLRVQPIWPGEDLTLTTNGLPTYYTARYEDV